MRKLLHWSPAILFAAIVGVVLAGKLGWFGYNTARLKLVNQSATDITEIRVSLYQQPCLIKRLAAGKSSVCRLPVKSDTHYTISWNEPDSGDFEEKAGYVTDGFDFNFQLEFLGDGQIDFKIPESG